MKTSPHHFLVLIDKQSQKKKMGAIGSILLHPSYVHMKFYLQHGVIQQIGSIAKREFELAEVGDTLLFHHFVEDGQEQLIKTLDNGDELRFVLGDNEQNNFQAFGIVKPDGTLIPAKHHLFLDTNIQLWESGKITSIDLKLSRPGDWNAEDQELDRLEALEAQAKSLSENYSHFANPNYQISEKELRALEPVDDAINSMMKERAEITRRMSQPKLAAATVLHIHPDNVKFIGIKEGDQVIVDSGMLYPYDVDGNQFFLLRRSLVDGVVVPDEEFG